MKQFVVLALISSLLVAYVCGHPLEPEQTQQLTLEDVDAQPIDDGAGNRVARFFGGGRGGFCCGGGGGFRRGGGFGPGYGGYGGRGGGGGGFGGSASASASASASSSFGGGYGGYGK